MSERLDNLYRKTFAYSSTDPEACLVFARKYAEAFCLEILRQNGAANSAKPRSLEDLIRQLTVQSILPAELSPPLRSIQVFGNAGSHEHEGAPIAFTENYVKPCLNALAFLHAHVQAWQAAQQLDALVQAPEAPREIRVATSRLTVVRAIEVAWQIESVLAERGFEASLLSYPWSNRILEDMADGRLDIAIYNRAHAEAFNAVREDGPVILGSFGHSMGGRNFYLLAQSDNTWARRTRGGASLVDDLANVTIALPLESDIAQNVQLALGLDDRGLAARGIKLFKAPASSGLEVFKIDSELLVSAGQNVRLLARLNGGYSEILNYDRLDSATQAEFVKRSENCLLISKDAHARLKYAGLGGIYETLRRNFLLNWLDSASQVKLIRALASVIELDGITLDDAINVSRWILFESYRIGSP